MAVAISSDSVVVVGALDRDEARGRIGAHELEELGKLAFSPKRPMTSQPSTQMWRVFWTFFGESLNVGEFIVSRLLHGAANRETPVFEDDTWIVDVVTVNRKFCKGREGRRRQK